MPAKLRATIPAIIAIRKINKTTLRVIRLVLYGVRIYLDTITTQWRKLTYIYPTIQSNLRSILRKFLVFTRDLV